MKFLIRERGIDAAFYLGGGPLVAPAQAGAAFGTQVPDSGAAGEVFRALQQRVAACEQAAHVPADLDFRLLWFFQMEVREKAGDAV